MIIPGMWHNRNFTTEECAAIEKDMYTTDILVGIIQRLMADLEDVRLENKELRLCVDSVKEIVCLK